MSVCLKWYGAERWDGRIMRFMYVNSHVLEIHVLEKKFTRNIPGTLYSDVTKLLF